MEYDIDHLLNKRSSQWKINFRAPIWIFLLIFIVAFLFGSFADDGYSAGMNSGSRIDQQSISKLNPAALHTATCKRNGRIFLKNN